jgi:hypothetical protein
LRAASHGFFVCVNDLFVNQTYAQKRDLKNTV